MADRTTHIRNNNMLVLIRQFLKTRLINAKKRPSRQCAKIPLNLNMLRVEAAKRRIPPHYILHTRRGVYLSQLSILFGENNDERPQAHANQHPKDIQRSQHRPNATQQYISGSGHNRTACLMSEGYRDIGTHRFTVLLLNVVQ